MEWHQGNLDIIHDAALSQAAYNSPREVHGWEPDLELSNENRTVYHKGGKAKVVFRGTKLGAGRKSLRDIGSDLLIVAGLQDVSSRMKNAVKTTDLAIAKYGKENVSLTGHSLGGSQAAYVSRKKGLKATGFNTAWSKIDEMRNRTYKHFHAIQIKADPIGARTANIRNIGKKTWVNSKHWNPHKISNFV